MHARVNGWCDACGGVGDDTFIHLDMSDSPTVKYAANAAVTVSPRLAAASVYKADEQVMPTKNDNPRVHELVMTDIAERMRVGTERYGTPLQAFNGRDVLKDMYEELLDAACYTRQMMYERDSELRMNAQAALDVRRLMDWFIQYAPDEIEEGSAVMNAIKLIQRLRHELKKMSENSA